MKVAINGCGIAGPAVVNEALRAGMENNRIADVSRPYRLEPVAMGEVTGPCDLDKAPQLADRLEDEETSPGLSARSVQGARAHSCSDRPYGFPPSRE